MAESNINILETYNKTFGHVGAPYPAFITQVGNPLETIQKTVKGAFSFKTEMGGEAMFPLMIDGWQLPVEPLISISGSNNIKETPLTRGEKIVNVLEYINLNNYKLRIRGVFFSNQDDKYPEEDVLKLRNLLERNTSITVKSDFLNNIFGITQIAIKNIGWPAVPGSPEMQGYTMECISDTSEEIDLTNTTDIK